MQDVCRVFFGCCAALLNLSSNPGDRRSQPEAVALNLSSAEAAASVAPLPVRMEFGPWAVSLPGRGDQKKGSDHEIHGEEAVAASPQAGVCQQAVNAVGDAPVELQLPLHYLALSVVQEKGTLRDGMGTGGVISQEPVFLESRLNPGPEWELGIILPL